MTNNLDEEYDSESSGLGNNYGKPSRAAIIAGVAVAIAVFMFGAFIKTYKQLESARHESKTETAVLKQEIESLKQNIAKGDAQHPPASAPLAASRRETAIPPRVTSEQELTNAPFPPVTAFTDEQPRENQVKTPMISAASGLSAFLSASKSRDAESPAKQQSEENRIRVIAVNSGQKKLMVEAGRDRGIAEGGRLELSRSGRWIGDLRVVAVFDNISACEVLHYTMLPEPGDVVRVPMQPAS
jgi:hypothetical protein